MNPFRRHSLARLDVDHWSAALQQPWDVQARDCIAYWAAQQLPLVVAQQPISLAPDRITLGLAAPLRWGRRRLNVQVPISGLLWLDQFPIASSIGCLLPVDARGPWQELCCHLVAAGVELRVYGSYGWQHLTGLDHVHPGSDLDLLMWVPDARSADRVVQTLRAAPLAKPRLDGELIFADGSAVAWREWLAWRTGRSECILVKRLAGPTLERKLWPLETCTC